MDDQAPPVIRTATEDERERVLGTISAAFLTDPMMRFVLPEPADYLRWVPVIAMGMAGPAFEQGAAFVSEDFRGAALWLPPGVHADPSEMNEHLPAIVPPEHVADVVATTEDMAAAHPEEPHWYLPLIGVEPLAQGRGLGAALMKQALERIDAAGDVAYLESSNPRNISLYERFGFEVTGRIQHGRGPLMTPMVRPAA
jgi:ribosomal protein S18 acetylase RimI-like enzyme